MPRLRFRRADSSQSRDTPPLSIIPRGRWRLRVDFVLCCIGAVIGTGNLWRFPYLVGKFGAAFLIPYAVAVILVGLPCVFLEVAMGQYSALPLHQLYCHFCPAIAGLGVAKIMTSILVALYYNMVLAWSVYFFAVSVWAALTGSSLPWASCTESMNASQSCFDGTGIPTFFSSIAAADNWSNTCNQSLVVSIWRDETERTNRNIHDYFPSHAYYHGHVLQSTGNIWDVSWDIDWAMALCLFVAWCLVFVFLAFGIHIFSRIVYASATMPFCFLLCLSVVGIFQDGALDGLEFYLLRPNWAVLLDHEVWTTALLQMFFSLGIGNGELTTLASYNHFHNNIASQMITVVVFDTVASLLAGLAVFSVLGSLARSLCLPVSSISEAGITLVFETYPYALGRLRGGAVWCAMFFLTLLLLGLDSEVAMVEVFVTCISDQWPKRRAPLAQMTIVGSVCLAFFLAGLVFTTPGGLALFTLFDDYSISVNVLMVSLLEFVVVLFCYGYKRFSADILEMIRGKETNSGGWRLRISNAYWKYSLPVGSVALIMGIAGHYVSKGWPSAESGGLYMFLLSVVWVPLALPFVALWAFLTPPGTCDEEERSWLGRRLARLLLPNESAWSANRDEAREVESWQTSFLSIRNCSDCRRWRARRQAPR